MSNNVDLDTRELFLLYGLVKDHRDELAAELDDPSIQDRAICQEEWKACNALVRKLGNLIRAAGITL